MAICDETVDGAPRWQAGFEVSVDDEPLDILAEIQKAACIQHAEIGGTWKIRVGPPGAPVWFHADGDLLSTEEAVFDPHPDLDSTYMLALIREMF